MIKDTVQLQGFPKMKLPKIKGTVEIKLHNPTTGKTEIHKGENMVTNAVADIFATNPCGALDYRNLLPLYSKMYGGILCFANSFTSAEMVATDYLMPDNSANTVTAHAGQTAYTDQADDTTRGNPSAANMSVEDGTVTLAWEWGLSSGNGAISALSLTHTDVGNAGTGSTSNAFTALNPIITNTICGTFTTNISNVTNFVFFVSSDGHGYRFKGDSNSGVTISKNPFVHLQTGIVANKPYLDTSMTETATCSISGNLDGDGPCYVYDNTTNKLWLFWNTSSSVTVNVEEIDLDDFGTSGWSATHHTLTIDSSANKVGPLKYGSWGVLTPSQLFFSNGYVYLPNALSSTVSYFVKVKLSNFSDQTRIGVNATPWGGSFNYPAKKVIVGHYGVINNDVYYPATYASPDIGPNQTPGYVPFTDPVSGLVASCSDITGSGNCPYYAGVSKFYLGTKYNLQTPVQKTPSQSMLITYTLTEVAPE